MIDLVTGASGFIGSALVSRLVEQRRNVRILVRPASRRDLLGPADRPMDIRIGDVTDPESLAGAFDGVERVYHCAGRIGNGGRREERLFYEINVLGTANVMNEALRSDVRRVIHVSSVAATGRSDDPSSPVDETSPWNDSRSVPAYSRSKYLGELEAQRAVAEGLDVVIVNPSLVFGPGRTGENTTRIAELVQRGSMRAYPAGATNVVDVEDVVTGILLAAERGGTGRRYILGGENLAWREILDALADAMNRPRPRYRLAPWLLVGTGAMMDLLPSGLGGMSRLTRDSARTASRRTVYDTGRARAELGWHPRPFSETAARLASHLTS